MKWSVIYEKAIREDGSLFFPQRLNREFLENTRKSMGSYLFANQYQNEIIPDSEKRFKPEWLRYYADIPKNNSTFAFVDPAIGQKKHHDYTGICVIHVDENFNWYLKVANRYRLTPTQIVDKLFEIQAQFNTKSIGIEAVAYQEALLYLVDQACRERKINLPVKGIKRSDVSKETRILGLVPRFEWSRLYLSQGLNDFEDEYSTFPRGSHDDLLDALASLEEIVSYPEKEKEKPLERPHSPHDPNYERYIIQQLVRQANGQSSAYDTDESGY